LRAREALPGAHERGPASDATHSRVAIAGLAAVSGMDEAELEPRLARLVHAELLTVTADAREVRWDASVADDEAARQALAGFYQLPGARAPGTHRPRVPEAVACIHPGMMPWEFRA